MKRSSYANILDSVRTTLLTTAENGVSPDEVKQVIVYLLSPYFEHQDILGEAAIPILAPEAVNIARINKDPWAKTMFMQVLNEYHQSKKVNSEACFTGFASWQNHILHASSEFVSILNLHRNTKSDFEALSIEDFKYEAFKGIGALIEANLQPYLRLLLHQVRNRRGKTNPEKGVDTMDLGVVVNELCQSSGYEELFAPPPWKIRLNQWRNMAQHHKSRVEENRIIGTYDIAGKQQDITLTREELFDALKLISLILSIIKGASSIFFIDNMDAIKTYITEPEVHVRPDIKVFQLGSTLATQGFDLKDIVVEEKNVSIILQDVIEVPENESEMNHIRRRIIHSSQFILLIWSYFPKEEVSIKHLDRQNCLRCTITGKGSDCEAVARGDITFEALAGKVVISLEKKFSENADFWKTS